MIYYNNLSAFTEVHLGNTNITEVYYGDVKKWPTGSQPFDGKFKLTLNDSSTVSAECGTSSAITRNEVSRQYSGSVVSAVIGDCVTSIDTYAFYNCSSLTSCTIGSAVTSIGNYVFWGCTALTSIYIPSGITSISTAVFYQCTSLTSATIPDSVITINNNAFFGCSNLTSIDIPDSVTNIGNNAFTNCSSLTSCTIGTGVTSIDSFALSNCTSLTGITCEAATPPTLGDYVFGNTNDCPIYVPAASLTDYQTAWSAYASRIQPIT